MRISYVIHILGGSLALLSGYFALSVKKGSGLHRKSGQLFVGAMLTVAFFGLVIAAGQGVAPAVNIPAALISAYLVVTSLTTVRPAGARWLHVGAMLVALATGLTSLSVLPSRLLLPVGRVTECRPSRSSCSGWLA